MVKVMQPLRFASITPPDNRAAEFTCVRDGVRLAPLFGSRAIFVTGIRFDAAADAAKREDEERVQQVPLKVPPKQSLVA